MEATAYILLVLYFMGALGAFIAFHERNDPHYSKFFSYVGNLTMAAIWFVLLVYKQFRD